MNFYRKFFTLLFILNSIVSLNSFLLDENKNGSLLMGPTDVLSFIREGDNNFVVVFNSLREEDNQYVDVIENSFKNLKEKYPKIRLALLDCKEDNKLYKASPCKAIVPDFRFYMTLDIFASCQEIIDEESVKEFVLYHVELQNTPLPIYEELNYDMFKKQSLAAYFVAPEISQDLLWMTKMIQRVFPDLPIYFDVVESLIEKTVFNNKGHFNYRVLLKRNNHSKPHVLNSNSPITPEDAFNFIEKYRRPRIQEIKSAHFALLDKPPVSALILFTDDLNGEDFNIFSEETIGLNLNGVYIKASLGTDTGRTMAEKLNLKPEDIPTVKLISKGQSNSDLYSMKKEFNRANLQSFLRGYKLRDESKYLKTEHVISHTTKKHLVDSIQFWSEKSKEFPLVLFTYLRHEEESERLREIMLSFSIKLKELESEAPLRVYTVDASSDYPREALAPAIPNFKFFKNGDYLGIHELDMDIPIDELFIIIKSKLIKIY